MISDTDMRGLSEPNGSWKTICSSRRFGRIASKESLPMSVPLNSMRPLDEIMRASARPSVVLPEPDSPTTPSVWPARTVTSMPSTALTWSTVLRKKPALDREPDLESSAAATIALAAGSATGGLPFGSAASRWRV